MKDLITYIVKALVDHPERVSVRAVGENHTEVLELEVAKVDIGKVIGRQGRTAQAMRTIRGATSAKEIKERFLKIVDQKLCRPKLL